VIGGKDLNSWPDLRLITDVDRHRVEDDAVEVQEDTRAQPNVEAVITVKRWTNDGALADFSEAFQQ
jgi:hypothetical protein